MNCIWLTSVWPQSCRRLHFETAYCSLFPPWTRSLKNPHGILTVPLLHPHINFTHSTYSTFNFGQPSEWIGLPHCGLPQTISGDGFKRCYDVIWRSQTIKLRNSSLVWWSGRISLFWWENACYTWQQVSFISRFSLSVISTSEVSSVAGSKDESSSLYLHGNQENESNT